MDSSLAGLSPQQLLSRAMCNIDPNTTSIFLLLLTEFQFTAHEVLEKWTQFFDAFPQQAAALRAFLRAWVFEFPEDVRAQVLPFRAAVLRAVHGADADYALLMKLHLVRACYLESSDGRLQCSAAGARPASPPPGDAPAAPLAIAESAFVSTSRLFLSLDALAERVFVTDGLRALRADGSVFWGETVEVIGQQLFHHVSALFNALSQRELVGQAWQQRDRAVSAPNVVNITEFFNRLSLWASSLVLCTVPRKQKNVFKFLVLLAEECRAQGNFDSMMAIVSGLNQHPVLRLHVEACAAEKVRALFERLDLLCAPTKNYAAYRQLLAECAGPAVPYVSLFLREMTYARDGNQMVFVGDATDSALLSRLQRKVNLDAVAAQHRTLSALRDHQRRLPRRAVAPKFARAFDMLAPVLDERRLLALSYLHKPPADGLPAADEADVLALADAARRATRAKDGARSADAPPRREPSLAGRSRSFGSNFALRRTSDSDSDGSASPHSPASAGAREDAPAVRKFSLHGHERSAEEEEGKGERKYALHGSERSTGEERKEGERKYSLHANDRSAGEEGKKREGLDGEDAGRKFARGEGAAQSPLRARSGKVIGVRGLEEFPVLWSVEDVCRRMEGEGVEAAVVELTRAKKWDGELLVTEMAEKSDVEIAEMFRIVSLGKAKRLRRYLQGLAQEPRNIEELKQKKPNRKEWTCQEFAFVLYMAGLDERVIGHVIENDVNGTHANWTLEDLGKDPFNINSLAQRKKLLRIMNE